MGVDAPPLSSHLAEHPGLLSTPLDAERKVSATEPSLIFFYETKNSNLQKPIFLPAKAPFSGMC